LESNGIKTLEQLSKYTVKEVLDFHGMGKNTISKLLTALKSEGLSFKK
jgi:DNA-directed RNA polymerase alpha subunit